MARWHMGVPTGHRYAKALCAEPVHPGLSQGGVEGYGAILGTGMIRQLAMMDNYFVGRMRQTGSVAMAQQKTITSIEPQGRASSGLERKRKAKQP